MLPQIQKVQAVEPETDMRKTMIDIARTVERLKAHLQVLTEAIGERSVRFPGNLFKVNSFSHVFIPGSVKDVVIRLIEA